MATALQLEIVTPERSAYSGPVSQVILPAWEGQLGVLPDHDPLLALLTSGVAVVFSEAGEQRYVIGRGFAEIGSEQVTVLTDSCLAAADVDKAKAQNDLTEAEQVLGEASAVTERFRQAEDRARHARARLEV